MTEFLSRTGAVSRIEEIIGDASGQVVLMSPYLKLSENLFDRLKRADTQGKKIILVYGKKQKWQVHTPHCKHCYREGFFDAGVSGLVIIILMIFAYGAEMMR